MIHCSSCGKPIEKVPVWLASAKAEFVCNNCPNRSAKNIAFVSLETEPKVAAQLDETDPVDVEELAEDLEEEEA
jgi:hypothetical protein